MEFESGTEQDAQQAESQTDTSQSEASATESAAPTIIDLDSAQNATIKFQGREWNSQDLSRAYMMQSDYTKKTQAIAEERKYWDNLEYDLARLKQDPNLAGQFMQIYPQKFHRYVDFVTGGQAATSIPGQTRQNNTQSQGIDPSFYREFQQMKADINERNVQAIQAELDAKFSVLQKKYPFADEEAILARADSLLQQGVKVTEQTWDQLWRANHQKMEKISKDFYSKQVASQKNANKKSSDIAPGGGIPGQAPRTPRTIKEASRFALEELENS